MIFVEFLTPVVHNRSKYMRLKRDGAHIFFNVKEETKMLVYFFWIILWEE